MLVPTLQNVVVQVAIAQDFWDNHRKCQDDLDRQNEGELSYHDHVINRMTARMLGLVPVVRKSRTELLTMYPKADQ